MAADHPLILRRFACPFCEEHFGSDDELHNHVELDHTLYVPRSGNIDGQGHDDHESELELDGDRSQGIKSDDNDQCGNSSTINRKRSASTSLSTAMICLDGISFDAPAPHVQHLLVDSFDVTIALHEARLSIQDRQWKLPLESHLSLALVLNNILLMVPGVYPDDLSLHFSEDNQNSLVKYIHERYGIKEQAIPLPLMTALIGVVDDVLQDKTSRWQARTRLDTMEMTKHERAISNVVANFVMRLPPDTWMEELHEVETCTSFADPLLHGLFDDPDNGITFRLDELYHNGSPPR